jgi:uncharacterized membrane protein
MSKRFPSSPAVAAAVATLLTVLGAASPALAEDGTGASADPPATVVVRSPNPDVTVGYVTGRATAVASNGVVAEGIAWKDVCIAPCTFKLPSGLQDITVTGPGYVGGVERVQLRPGENHIVARPGSAAVRIGGILLGGLGLAAAVTGGTFMLLPRDGTSADPSSWALPLLLGGLGATGVGVAMMVMSSTSIEHDDAPRAEARVPAARGAALGYSWRF